MNKLWSASSNRKCGCWSASKSPRQNLLKEFRKWAVRIEARGKVAETSLTAFGANLSGFNERLNVLEERLDDIEGNNDRPTH